MLKHLTALTILQMCCVLSNKDGNRLWTDDGYDHSTWLLTNGTIEAEQFWERIELACGMLWMPNAATEFSADPCDLY